MQTDLPAQLYPVHIARHPDVREDDIDRTLAAQDSKRSGRVANPLDPVPELLEHFTYQHCNLVVVLHEQHRSREALFRLRRARSRKRVLCQFMGQIG